jgi:hypothetical protein
MSCEDVLRAKTGKCDAIARNRLTGGCECTQKSSIKKLPLCFRILQVPPEKTGFAGFFRLSARQLWCTDINANANTSHLM